MPGGTDKDSLEEMAKGQTGSGEGKKGGKKRKCPRLPEGATIMGLGEKKFEKQSQGKKEASGEKTTHSAISDRGCSSTRDNDNSRSNKTRGTAGCG